MSTQFVTSLETTRFTPTALLELWVLDGTAIGLDTVYYFCNMTNETFNGVVFNGLTYTPFPIQMTDMGTDGKGTLVRPKLTVSNVNGFISALLLQNQQLNGATIIRRRVFARFIDAANFGGNVSPYTPNPSAAYPDEIWTVNRKITENQQIVQWELVSPVDLQNIKLPRRQIISATCAAPWKYRDGRTCGYSGLPVADNANRTFLGNYGYNVVDRGQFDAATTYNQGDAVFIYSSLVQFRGIPIYYVCTTDGTLGANPVGSPGLWIADQCSKTPAACKLRFVDVPLRGAFFPGTSRAAWISLT